MRYWLLDGMTMAEQERITRASFQMTFPIYVRHHDLASSLNKSANSDVVTPAKRIDRDHQIMAQSECLAAL